MAAPTEKDLENMQAHNRRLREQIADAEAKAAANVQEKSREIEAAYLQAETVKLEAQLQAAREQAKSSVAKSGAQGPLEAAKEQQKAAEAGVTPPGVTVDTNPQADSSAEDTKE